MADDTRQATNTKATPSASMPDPRAVPAARENANMMPGGALNTAGGKMQEAGLVDAAKTIHLSDFNEVHKKPCARDAFMTGIGAGFGVGGVRAILGGSIFRCCNWAVGSSVLGAAVMYEYCQRKRQMEKQGMKRAVEIIDRKKSEKSFKAEQARAARTTAKGES